MNATYRGQRRATNVLAFPGPQPGNLPAGLEPELGDILICLPVAEAEADDQGKTLVAHLAHLVVHGALHLLGYDHHADGEAEIMEGLERRVLSQLGFPDPYAQGRD
jgi:probable rRNA maturation factor